MTGGIAAYKAAEVVSLLVKRGAQVRVAMTEHAQKFVTPLTMETLSGNGVSADLFAPRQSIAHIALARWGGCVCGRAVHGQRHRQVCQRHRRRPSVDDVYGHALPGCVGAGDERGHVAKPRQPRKT